MQFPDDEEDDDRGREAEPEREARREPHEERRICPDCRGRNVNLINPEDGGGCPSCIGGYVL